MCDYSKIKHCFESTSHVDTICLILFNWCCKYSPFVFLLFVEVEVNERLEFATSPCYEGSKSIEMDVKVNAIVDGLVGLLIPSIKFCQHFNKLYMTCSFVDFRWTNIFWFYKTTFFDPLSLDVHAFNFYNVPTTFLSRFLHGIMILDS